LGVGSWELEVSGLKHNISSFQLLTPKIFYRKLDIFIFCYIFDVILIKFNDGNLIIFVYGCNGEGEFFLKKLEVGSWKLGVNYRYLNDINMKFKFEKLTIWQQAMDYGETINKLALSFPKHEAFNLSEQIRRAVDSIALNISEGAIGQSAPEFKRFLGFSIRSLAEVVTCLYKARRRNYISEQEFSGHYEFAFNLMNMMLNFRTKVK
jgi:four helix bundle protein